MKLVKKLSHELKASAADDTKFKLSEMRRPFEYSWRWEFIYQKVVVVCWVLGCLVCCRLIILEIWKIFSRPHDRSDIHIILFRCKLTDSERHEDEWKSHENEIYSLFSCVLWLRWNLRFPVDRKKTAWCRIWRIWWEESLRRRRQQMAKLCASNWTLKFKVPSHLDWWWWHEHDHDQSQHNKFCDSLVIRSLSL